MKGHSNSGPLRVMNCAGKPSPRLVRACARFGLGVRGGASARRPRSPHFRAAAERVCDELSPARIVLVTGASGSGKTTLLREVARGLRGRMMSVRWVAPPGLAGSVIDGVGGPLPRALRMLSLVGLGDATLMGRTPDQLSEGERFRLALAAALSRTRPGGVLLCDEFTSALDRHSARRLCAGLSRWVRAARACVVVATPHEDTRGFLDAWAVTRCDESGVTIDISGKQEFFETGAVS